MSRLFIFFQYLLPHHLLSRGVGILAQNHLLRKLFIRTFIKRYKVDLSQAKIQDVEKFENFNAFFTPVYYKQLTRPSSLLADR